MSELILITGGARSGKSGYALKLVMSLEGGYEVVYIATAYPVDAEMGKRISEHIKERPKDWLTVEEPVDVSGAIERRITPCKKPVIILDCLTVLISNLMSKGLDDTAIYKEISTITETLRQKSILSVIVTNEVGYGIVPEHRLARRFRDVQGRANQMVADVADYVYLMVCGIPLRIKGRSGSPQTGSVMKG